MSAVHGRTNRVGTPPGSTASRVLAWAVLACETEDLGFRIKICTRFCRPGSMVADGRHPSTHRLWCPLASFRRTRGSPVMADLMRARQPIASGASAMIRMRSGTCEVDVALTAAVVSGVRDLMSACLRLWGLDELEWRVSLTASELLTNAFQHARREDEDSVPVRVVLTCTPDGIFLSVSDPHPQHPAPVFADDEDESGRGLRLVKALSDGYGCSATTHGKDVWATILRTA
ncbi:ATP-binding protein [Streptomyces sp. NPDC090994]|uniref:ATP-binding protein n=1 Tax=Streptomyces sp. NPDC090994 TaxID=3365969 RepID=UPI003826E562